VVSAVSARKQRSADYDRERGTPTAASPSPSRGLNTRDRHSLLSPSAAVVTPRSARIQTVWHFPCVTERLGRTFSHPLPCVKFSTPPGCSSLPLHAQKLAPPPRASHTQILKAVLNLLKSRERVYAPNGLLIRRYTYAQYPRLTYSWQIAGSGSGSACLLLARGVAGACAPFLESPANIVQASIHLIERCTFISAWHNKVSHLHSDTLHTHGLPPVNSVTCT
jgi:hypothetical protein